MHCVWLSLALTASVPCWECVSCECASVLIAQTCAIAHLQQSIVSMLSAEKGGNVSSRGGLMCISLPPVSLGLVSNASVEPALPPQAKPCNSGLGSCSREGSFLNKILFPFRDSWLNMACVLRLPSWEWYCPFLLPSLPLPNNSFLARDALHCAAPNCLTRVQFQKQTLKPECFT